ncbi:hypothetical protein HGH93_06085 [Chitinophaga polysaccharea]|uniref:hypothetical protein n=1 Tax=Chitinophaga TaxID=79328 RepID=UPI001455462D|nr:MULTISPECIES: hypothetical protein [Chitinophaga]NLR57658.1 hypothetical protein [Chitinophaga polysaccharea]NLU93250.1 hypothetical protein [Chitinophaga sp. Ak27]
MRTEADIRQRMAEIRGNLSIIEEKAKIEMAQYVGDISIRKIHFLFQEKKVWEYALNQLEWILEEIPHHHSIHQALQHEQ